MLIGSNSKYYIFFEMEENIKYNMKVVTMTRNLYNSKKKLNKPKIAIILKNKISEMIFKKNI